MVAEIQQMFGWDDGGDASLPAECFTDLKEVKFDFGFFVVVKIRLCFEKRHIGLLDERSMGFL